MLRRYPVYVDSGVWWLGKVPEHWAQLPGKACYREKKTSNAGMRESKVLSLSYGKIVVKPTDTLHGLVPESFETYQIVEAGDIVVRPTDLQNDWNSLRFALSLERGIITSAYMCLRTRAVITPELGHLLLHTYDMKKVFYGLGSGLRQNLDWRDFKYLPCLVPPLLEQSAIVRYLGYMDRRVRRYIRAKQKLITLLSEQKQAIIQSVVTRGLDSDVRLKPSGVEWLGEVPEHWEVKRLRNLTTHVTSGSRGWSDFAADDGPLFLRIGNLTRDSLELDLQGVVRLNLPSSVVGETARTRVMPDDILLSITAYIGSVAVVPHDLGEAYVSQHVACCRLTLGAANPRWIGYVLLSPVGQTHGSLCMYGGTKQGLSLDDVGNYVVVLPPRGEQDRAVDRIEDQIATVDSLLGSTRRKVDLVREHHTRLVADVVTGNLDVHEAAARLPHETDELEPSDAIADVAVGDDVSLEGDAEAALEEVEI